MSRQRSATPAKYVSLYEFDYAIEGRPCAVGVTAVCGHLMGQDFDAAHRKWHSCAPRALFDAPLETVVNDMDGNGPKIKALLQREARRSDLLIVATDNDREGENIAYEVPV